ncbi:MAG: holo-ACP synthase [Oscillatoriales cyanobacterium RU_3_3]|nr:holo-ACP synthase [Microcoleus sp. SU_5_6]NJL67290.1 holo-ACP synthase [Microcoleus sp. SM1_3_4]NJM59650.1 holo-ACP synthase [Oscillatoriales cyanobacterium RU_3_3]NJR24325.1 holo-ACP synthase [Richelia sp. CSU_2_1]
MNIYLGTDLVYVPRIQAALDRFGDRFLQKVYTPTEQQDCKPIDCARRNKAKMSRDSSQQLAGRWAAKEAVVKALGTGWRGLRYTEVEIQRSSSGAPNLFLHGAAAVLASAWGNCQWQLSLSHDGDYCTATAIALCTPPSTIFVPTHTDTKI